MLQVPSQITYTQILMYHPYTLIRTILSLQWMKKINQSNPLSTCLISNGTTDNIESPASKTTNSHHMVTRSKSDISKAKSYITSKHQLPKTLLAPTLETEPTCYTTATKYPEWSAAMDQEFNSLQKSGTWTLVPVNSKMNVVCCKWIYRIKCNPDGLISRYKARLFAKSFHQIPGLDFLDTFCPVVKPTTIRTALAIANNNNWPIRQLDVESAFLHGEIKEEVYMIQPPGYADPIRPTHVCKMVNSIYGLRQAPRAWYQKFTSHLLEMGFMMSYFFFYSQIW